MDGKRTDTPTIAEQTPAFPPCSGTGETYSRRFYHRQIHPEWSKCGDPVGNLLAEINDMNSRPELLSESDERFLIYIIKRRIRTFRDGSQAVYLTDRHVERLEALTRRYTQGHLAERFLRARPH